MRGSRQALQNAVWGLCTGECTSQWINERLTGRVKLVSLYAGTRLAPGTCCAAAAAARQLLQRTTAGAYDDAANSAAHLLEATAQQQHMHSGAYTSTMHSTGQEQLSSSSHATDRPSSSQHNSQGFGHKLWPHDSTPFMGSFCSSSFRALHTSARGLPPLSSSSSSSSSALPCSSAGTPRGVLTAADLAPRPQPHFRKLRGVDDPSKWKRMVIRIPPQVRRGWCGRGGVAS